MTEDEKPRNTWELLHQERWWVNKKKEWVDITELEDLEYACNILRFITNRATRYGAQVAAWLRYETLRLPLPEMMSDMTELAVDSVMDEMWEEAFTAERKTDVWWATLEFPCALKKRVSELKQKKAEEELLEHMLKAGGV
jgi:hypothetical protein